MEIEKVGLTISRLKREAETLDIICKRKMNKTKDEKERQAIDFEYSTAIQNLAFSIMELEQFVTNQGLESVSDVDKVLQTIRKK